MGAGAFRKRAGTAGCSNIRARELGILPGDGWICYTRGKWGDGVSLILSHARFFFL